MSHMQEATDFAQAQRDELRGSTMGRATTTGYTGYRAPEPDPEWDAIVHLKVQVLKTEGWYPSTAQTRRMLEAQRG